MTAPDYFTRWNKSIPLKKVNDDQVSSLLNQFIISRFGIPNSLGFDNAYYFSSLKLTEYNSNNLFLRSRPGDLTGKVYGGIHTLPPSGFELVNS